MDNQVIFHNIQDNTQSLLTKCSLRCVFEINQSIISLQDNGYYVSGVPLDSSFKIYKDSSNNFYVVKVANASTKYISINTLAVNRTGSPMINSYTTNYDVTNLTELNQLNENNHTWSTGRISVTANETYEYTSKINYRQYNAETSLVFVSLRNSNGNGGSGLFLLHRMNTNSKAVFTVETIYADSGISRFNITGTTNGFTVSDTVGYQVNVTEIAQAF